MKKLLFIAASIGGLWAGGCTGFKEGDTNAPEGRTPSGNSNGVTLAIVCGEGAANETQTRTDIGDDAQSVRWSEDDQVTVWAQSATDNSWALDGVTFALAYYRPEWHNAVFLGTANAMPEDNYTYYAVSPEPSSISGTTATFRIPATQSGAYGHDILVAEPVGGTNLPQFTSSDAALAELPEHEMAFRHKCHMLRIEIPEGRDKWGETTVENTSVKRIVMEFSRDVVGDVSVDATNPAAPVTLANATRTVTLEAPESLTDGDGNYHWISLCPTSESTDVTITCYSAEGHMSRTMNTTIPAMAEGRVTPLTMTLPEEMPYAKLNFTLATNNLGEAPTKITVTAPAGVRFRNGSDVMELTPTLSGDGTGQHIGSVGFYPHLYGPQAAAGDFQLHFESEHAHQMFSAVRAQGTAGVQNFNVAMPYLYEVAFTGDKGVNGGRENGVSNPAEINFGFGYDGWTGVRVEDWGDALRMSVRVEAGGRYPGRMVSPQMARLKQDANATLNVRFVGAKDDKNLYLGFGTKNDNNRLPSMAMQGMRNDNYLNNHVRSDLNINAVNPQYVWKGRGTNSNDNLDRPNNVEEFTVNNANNTTRIAWYTLSDTAEMWHLYTCSISEVKIKIVSQQ